MDVFFFFLLWVNIFAMSEETRILDGLQENDNETKKKLYNKNTT